jgi:hypothetical protein
LLLCLALTALMGSHEALGGPRECRASFSIDKDIKDLSSAAAGLGQKPARDVFSVGFYVAYKAFAARKPKLCAQLRSLDFMAGLDDAMVNGEQWCRGEYAKMVFAREFNEPSPNFAAACRRFISDLPGRKKKSPEEAARACVIIARDRLRPAELCEELASGFDMRSELPECLCAFGALTGQTEPCARHVARTPRHVGPRDEDAYAALSAAHQAKDPALCGESLMCRQIMGVDVTGEFAAKARDAACGDAPAAAEESKP